MKRPFKFRSDYGPVLSPDGQHVATFVRDVSLFDVESRKKVWKAHPFSYPSELAFDSSGEKLAVKSCTGQIVIFDAITGSMLIDFENQDDGEGSNICFSDCGEFLIDGSWEGVLTVRSVNDRAVVAQHIFERQMIQKVACFNGHVFVHHSHIMGATSFSRWKWPMNKLEYDKFPFEPNQAKGMNPLSADSFVVGYGHPRSEVDCAQPVIRLAIVDLNGARDLCETSDYGRIDGLTVSPTHRFVACAVEDHVLFVDLETQTVHHIMEAEGPFSFSFSADGSRIAIGADKDSQVVSVEDILPDDLA